VRQSFPLQQLRQARVLPEAEVEGSLMKCVELHMSTKASLASKRHPNSPKAAGQHTRSDLDADIATYALAGEQHLMLLAVAWQLLRHSDQALPRLVGYEASDLAAWWVMHKAQVLRALGEFAAQVLDPEGCAAAGGEGGAAGARVLLSAKEERELEELLDSFKMGLGDSKALETRLNEEYNSLEDANVHSLLANVPLVDSLVFQLRRTSTLLEDVDETLQVFDTKLRAMRADITAIETHNNLLELTARNNTRLLATLKGLLADISLPSDIHDILENPDLDQKRLASVCKAGWLLVDKLSKLTSGSASCLPPDLLR
ncbi:Sec3_C domain-containing protein, partial [Haematococcus lacustris]